MRRDTGLWSNVRANAYDDPRTAAAAAVLVSGGVPAYVAPLVVVTAMHRLECWAIGDGDEGLTGHLEPERLAAVAWPEHVQGPRTYGRGERLGSLLRAALRATPRDGSSPYLVLGCAGGCPDQQAVKVRGIVLPTCIHERINEWTIRLPTLVADRLDKRARKERKSCANADLPPTSPPSAPPSPPRSVPGKIPGRSGDVPPYPIPSQPQRGEEQSGIPSSLAQFADAGPRGGPPRRAADVAAAILAAPRMPSEGTLAAGPGSARNSSAPGAGAGDGDGIRGGAVRALLGAEPNLREQQRNGRDLTLRAGAHYLFRIGAGRPGLRRDLERELGPAPAPGALLFRADPGRMERLGRVLSSRWASLRNPEAYVRSTLASAWAEYFVDFDRELARERQAASAAPATEAAAPSALTSGA